MRQFFKFLFASFFGTILASVIGFFILAGVIGAIASMGGKKEVEVKEKSLLKLSLSTPITDRQIEDPFADIEIDGLKSNVGIGLPVYIKALRAAAEDDKIKGIYLDLSMIPSGRATIEEVRNAIIDFKASGKPIYAYADFYTQSNYYIACLADSIFMQPTGMMDFSGRVFEMMFFRGAFDKLGIDPRVIKHGDYKSAGESFSEKQMSPANREQMTALMQSFYTHYLHEVATQRGIDSAKLRSIATELKVRTPQDAIEHGLIDKLIYKDEMLQMMADFTGAESFEDIETIGVTKYASTVDDGEFQKDKVAVIYAVGGIQMGEGDDQVIGASRISKAVRKARLDEKVKAIVLRVNSPGGSALASDIILREVELAQKVKPVVVSMGDVAASGGYYIACKADEIIAQPNTITGSIGVIGIIPGTKDFFNEKLGITFDRIKTGPYADLGNPNRDMTDEEYKIIQNSLDRIYVDFITHVAEGRGMDTAKVNELGRGRVWTGLQAIDNGLIDRLGSLEDAVASAAEKANLEGYEIKEFPKAKNPFESFFNQMQGVKARMIQNEVGEEQYEIYKRMKWMQNLDEPLMLMPYKF